MPTLDVEAVPERRGSGYPRPFDAPCAQRIRQRLGDAGGLRDFGVNRVHVPPAGPPHPRIESDRRSKKRKPPLRSGRLRAVDRLN